MYPRPSTKIPTLINPSSIISAMDYFNHFVSDPKNPTVLIDP